MIVCEVGLVRWSRAPKLLLLVLQHKLHVRPSLLLLKLLIIQLLLRMLMRFLVMV